MRMAPHLLLTVAIFFGASTTAQANLLTDGSFESPTAPTNYYTAYAPGSTAIPGWTVVGPAGSNVAILNGSYTDSGVSIHANYGSQWLDLTGTDGHTGQGVSQTVTTVAGDLYQLSYYVGNVGNCCGGNTSTVDVQLNGVQTYADENTTVTNVETWELFTHTFTATGTSMTLLFANGDPITDGSNGLDNIVLIDLGPASNVPEPASLALLAAGLASVGWMHRRRKQRHVGARDEATRPL